MGNDAVFACQIDDVRLFKVLVEAKGSCPGGPKGTGSSMMQVGLAGRVRFQSVKRGMPRKGVLDNPNGVFGDSDESGIDPQRYDH